MGIWGIVVLVVVLPWALAGGSWLMDRCERRWPNVPYPLKLGLYLMGMMGTIAVLTHLAI